MRINVRRVTGHRRVVEVMLVNPDARIDIAKVRPSSSVQNVVVPRPATFSHLIVPSRWRRRISATDQRSSSSANSIKDMAYLAKLH